MPCARSPGRLTFVLPAPKFAELASRHDSGTYDFKVVPRLLNNLWNLVLDNLKIA